MTTAFWDTSALVPLCLQQPSSSASMQLLRQYQITVWWTASVEMRSAFERLLRMNQLTPQEYEIAGARLEKFRRGWRELQPTVALRSQAEIFLKEYPLKAADSLQLAAAWIWCAGHPQACIFIAGDVQLLATARQIGFQTVAL